MCLGRERKKVVVDGDVDGGVGNGQSQTLSVHKKNLTSHRRAQNNNNNNNNNPYHPVSFRPKTIRF